MKKITCEGTKINFGRKQVDLGFKILKNLQLNDKVIVLFNWFAESSDKSWDQNIVAFDFAGNELWRIALSPGIGSGSTPYSNVFWDKTESKVLVYALSGIFYELDVNTGFIKIWDDPENPGPQRPW